MHVQMLEMALDNKVEDDKKNLSWDETPPANNKIDSKIEL
jgi:hypothetical protein